MAGYFGSPYYGGGSSSPGVANPPAGGGRDRDVFRAIRDALEATGSFAAILLHKAADHARAGPDRNPIATVRRTGHRESDLCCNPITRERAVSYDLAVAVRCEDEAERFEWMERLQEVAVNALDGRCLAGMTWPFRTTLARGQDDPGARHPEQRVILKGSFSYEVRDYGGRDQSE